MDKILIIEDDNAISDLIKLNLEMAEYNTIQAIDGEEGISLIEEEKPDLIILDLMIPKPDGYELMPKIVERNIPVIILTAKDSLVERVYGLNLGADDYITKPFEAVELIARIKAVLRRHRKINNSKEADVALNDDIQILYESRKVYKGNDEIDLTLKEFELLSILVENKDIALTRQVLLDKVWGYEFEGNTRTVDMHIQKLRRKLQTNKIKTVHKYGYRFED